MESGQTVRTVPRDETRRRSACGFVWVIDDAWRVAPGFGGRSWSRARVGGSRVPPATIRRRLAVVDENEGALTCGKRPRPIPGTRGELSAGSSAQNRICALGHDGPRAAAPAAEAVGSTGTRVSSGACGALEELGALDLLERAEDVATTLRGVLEDGDTGVGSAFRRIADLAAQLSDIAPAGASTADAGAAAAHLRPS